jgi:hypothetical protein
VQDIFGFLGWKKMTLSFLVGIGTFLQARFSGLTAVQQFVLALLSFACVLVIVNLIPHTLSWLRGFRWPFAARGPALRFGMWHGGTSFGYPARVNDGCASWISVKNIETAIPQVAKNVSARIEFVNAANTTRLTIPEADWFALRGDGVTQSGSGWSRNISIDGGGDQSFVLLVRDDRMRLWVYKNGTEQVGVLDNGQWEASILVSSDNAEGFEGILNFPLGRAETKPNFKMRRRVRPRLRGGLKN